MALSVSVRCKFAGSVVVRSADGDVMCVSVALSNDIDNVSVVQVTCVRVLCVEFELPNATIFLVSWSDAAQRGWVTCAKRALSAYLPVVCLFCLCTQKTICSRRCD